MKASTPTPYTLFAAALGATARSMLCSHTVPHRFAVIHATASETHVAQRRMVGHVTSLSAFFRLHIYKFLEARTQAGRGGSAECVCGEGVFGWCEQCANSGVCCSVPSPMEARLSPSQVLPLAGCGAGGRHTVGCAGVGHCVVLCETQERLIINVRTDASEEGQRRPERSDECSELERPQFR